MKKFIVTYHAGKSAMEEMGKSTPEESKKSMEKWHQWAEKCGEGLVDLGSPLGNAQDVKSSGSSESDSDIVGYSVLQAEGLDQALKMLEGHPHLGWNEECEIKVHEALPLPE